jgi:hypothetical protein
MSFFMLVFGVYTMSEVLKRVLAGALGGFVSAVLVDLNAWSRSSSASGSTSDDSVPDFDWGLAVKRWVSGAVSGALAAGGFSGLGGLS